jgi:hypothetical protein
MSPGPSIHGSQKLQNLFFVNHCTINTSCQNLTILLITKISRFSSGQTTNAPYTHSEYQFNIQGS